MAKHIEAGQLRECGISNDRAETLANKINHYLAEDDPRWLGKRFPKKF